MTNPTNIFNYVPHDVTQWKIAPFLTAEERATFNSVLEQPERVYKKFPKDFAEKHAVKIAYAAQDRHAARINFFMTSARDAPEDSWTEYAIQGVNAMGKYVDFFTKPVAVALFKYRARKPNAKQAITELTNTLGDDTIYADFITEAFREKVLKAIDVIKSIVPEKHVS